MRRPCIMVIGSDPFHFIHVVEDHPSEVTMDAESRCVCVLAKLRAKPVPVVWPIERLSAVWTNRTRSTARVRSMQTPIAIQPRAKRTSHSVFASRTEPASSGAKHHHHSRKGQRVGGQVKQPDSRKLHVAQVPNARMPPGRARALRPLAPSEPYEQVSLHRGSGHSENPTLRT